MANFTTVNDLRRDALWIAGEATTNASSYYDRSLEYLNAVFTAILSGGPLGLEVMPSIDWWWAQKSSRGQVVVPRAINTNNALTVSLTSGSATVTFSGNVSPSLAGYRVRVTDHPEQLLYISSHTSGSSTATADLQWQLSTTSGKYWVAWKDQASLPTDFIRFTTELLSGSHPSKIPVVDYAVLERDFPRHLAWIGTPKCAAISHAGAGVLTLHFSHAPKDTPLVLEFEYMAKPAELVDSSGTEEPPIPHQHRRILSLGAAYLMLFDKVDKKYAMVGKMFMDAWQAMAEEHYRQVTDGSMYGRLLIRGQDALDKIPLRSPSGHIYG